MPTIPDIRTSVENKNALVLDEHTKHGTFLTDSRNRLISYPGGFSVVFPYEVSNGEKWAFRCWHRDLGNLRSHFEILSEELQNLKIPYFCDFTYVDEGINVNGLIYPTTRMRWIDGENLKDFLYNHKTERERLKKLAETFLTMIQCLHENSIAHGDLQHGNILIDNADKMFLIDYDSVYLPSLLGQTDFITGFKDYQHPSRVNNVNASEKLDYFSELIIYTSILAIAEDSSLADKYNLKDTDRLLFSNEDFNNIEASEIYGDLMALKGLFPNLLAILKDYLSKSDINELTPFDQIMKGLYREPIIHSFEADGIPIVALGKEITIKWDVENISDLYLNNEPLEVYQRKHIATFDTLGKHSFELTVVNGLQRVSRILDIEVVDGPIIYLKSDVYRLRKGKNEKTQIEWVVENAKSAVLIADGSESSINLKGQKSVSPESTTTFTIRATSIDEKQLVENSITILVSEESSVTFEADKLFSLPRIPVTIRWDVKNAKEVFLDDNKVLLNDSVVKEFDKETTLTLRVVDDFGSYEHPLTIKMLPIPVIRSILAPAPNLIQNIQITNMVPRISVMNEEPDLSLEPPRFNDSIPKFRGMPQIPKQNTSVKTGFSGRLWRAWNHFESLIKNHKS